MSLTAFPHFGGQIQRGVFPLIVKIDDQLLPVGTGFAINPNGLFITAAHVLTEAHKKAVRRRSENGSYYDHYEFYALYVSDEPSGEGDSTIGGLLPIDRVWAPIELDIGFGWLRLPIRVSDNTPLRINVVSLRPKIPSVGDPICGMGYYEMAGTFSAADNSIIEYFQNTAIASGTVEEVHPQFRDRGLLSFPCFRTDATFNHGMSGGPIFDKTGHVIGVICSGDTQPGMSYGSLIWPIFGAKD